MLAKKYRLPVQSVLSQKGIARRGRYFYVKVFKAALPYSRAGVVVSGKVAPKASARNKLKRLVYEKLRVVLPQLAAADYLVIAQPAVYEIGAADGMIKELENLLKSKLGS